MSAGAPFLIWVSSAFEPGEAVALRAIVRVERPRSAMRRRRSSAGPPAGARSRPRRGRTLRRARAATATRRCSHAEPPSPDTARARRWRSRGRSRRETARRRAAPRRAAPMWPRLAAEARVQHAVVGTGPMRRRSGTRRAARAAGSRPGLHGRGAVANAFRGHTNSKSSSSGGVSAGAGEQVAQRLRVLDRRRAPVAQHVGARAGELLAVERLRVEVLQQELGRDPEVREGEVVVGRCARHAEPGTAERRSRRAGRGHEETPSVHPRRP